MLNSLQACRAIAALLVVLYHTSHGIFRLDKYFGHKPFGVIFDFGFAGVDFFFVLSGFIMMHVHARDIGKPSAIGSYLWKRLTRIYPAYWVVLLAILPVFYFNPHFGAGVETRPDVVWRAFLLVPHPEGHPVLGVAWTLVYEVFFYLLFGLLILNRRVGILVFVAWTSCVLAYPWFDQFPWSFLFSPLHFRFLAGVAVGFVLQRLQLPAPRLVAAAGAAVFFGTGLCEAYAGPLTTLDHTIGFTLGSALMLAGVVQAERSGLLQTPRLLRYLGDASYSIYLVHFLALSVLAKITTRVGLEQHVPGAVLFVLLAVGATAIGCAFHHVIEKPIHQWTRGYFTRVRVAPVVAVGEEPNIRKAA